MPKIICFGDSITWGAWDSEGGWVARLRKRLDEEFINAKRASYFLTYNCGISSDTSENMLQRFDNQMTALMKESGGEPYLIFSIGTNDSIRSVKDKAFWVDEAHFKDNLVTIIDKAKKFNSKIVVLGNAPVNEAETHPYSYNPDVESNNADIQKYNQITQAVCTEKGVGFIPVFDEFLAKDSQAMLFRDGVHPNDAGHAFLAEKVWDYMQQNGWLA